LGASRKYLLPSRKYLLLGIDLLWVAISPFAALFIRDSFALRAEALTAAIPHAYLGLVVAAVVFPIAGLNRTFWRYTSLSELVRLQLAVTVTVLLAMLATFAHTRLLDISRSLPLLQWFFLVAVMTGTRLAIRVWRERSAVTGQQFMRGPATKNVLIVGVNRLAEVYVRAMAEFGVEKFSVVGFLAREAHLHGRLLQSHKVLGVPEDLLKVAQELEVHGTWLDRIVVTEDLRRLSPSAQQALLDFERSSEVKIDWLPELLGFASSSEEVLQANKTTDAPACPTPSGPKRRQRYPKRIFDLFAAAILLIITAPLFAAITLLIAVDVGLPVVFWQSRPGRYGRPFKLYKFRTMRAPHDELGNRILDQDRVSRFGALLRLTRLDELPQLYNILVGEMSFVGPRPLLVTDHGPGTRDRLIVRPGLTGWAQVNGGRKLAAEDKAALDIWYAAHLSLGLDFRIALYTVHLLFSGERINQEAVRAARGAVPTGDGAPGAVAVAPRLPKLSARVHSAA
jgi:lipopolysaccharide/colanic/teichoic acid biosynthesis glycosyltransferase